MELGDSSTEAAAARAATGADAGSPEEGEPAAGRHRWRLALEQRWSDALEAGRRAEQGPREPASAELEPAALAGAEAVAEVGATIPEFAYYPAWQRALARPVARLVLFLAGIVTAHQRIVNRALLGTVRRLLGRVGEAEAELAALARRTVDWERELAFLRLALADADHAASDWQTTIGEHEERLARLTARTSEIERRLDASTSSAAPAPAPALVGPADGAADGVADGADHGAADGAADYVAFEDRFRGPRELIARRLSVHLPLVVQAARRHEGGEVLDLGCGRGEWLAMLRERQVAAVGADTDPRMVELCRRAGLDARLDDALGFLRRRRPASVAAITAFHLFEHLPHELVLALLDEAARVLRPGALLLVECPNPENLRVGACDFWRDPTHRRPIHPETLAFLFERRGFRHVRIERLSAHRGGEAVAELAGDEPGAERLNPVIRRLNELVAVAPDFCVAGERPWPDADGETGAAA